jgi:lysophospholipase L1-like esterase
MKKQLFALVTVVALTVALAAPASAEAPGLGKYLALGDSAAVGVGATDPARLGYVGRVGNLSGRSHRGADYFENLAVGGETSGSFLTGQLGAAIAAINDPATDIELVTLDIGGNDLLDLLYSPACQPDPTVPACQAAVASALNGFAGNFPTIMGGLMAALEADPGDETVLVMTCYNPFSGTGSAFEGPVDGALLGSDGGLSPAGADPAPGLNDLIAWIAGAFGATVIDVKPQFDGKALVFTHIGEGDIHPNNAGYATIASAFIREVR